MKFDLHIHSCLSACGDLEMSPSAIAARAQKAGLDAIAIADHNSGRNHPALAESCRRIGLGALFGLEITTAEEAHVLAIFETPAAAARMTAAVYDALPKRVNVPDVFGDQPVVTADEEVEEFEWHLLSAATKLSVEEVGKLVHELGGLYIAAHIDRGVSSVTSQLGAVPDAARFDGLELSAFADESEWRARYPGHGFIRSSDSHYLHAIGRVWTELAAPQLTLDVLRAALRDNLTRLSPPLARGGVNLNEYGEE